MRVFFLLILWASTTFAASAPKSVADEVVLEKFYFQTEQNILLKDIAALNLQLGDLKYCQSDCDRMRSVFLLAFEELMNQTESREVIAEFWKFNGFGIFRPHELVRVQAILHPVVGIYNFDPFILAKSAEDQALVAKAVCAYKNLVPQEYLKLVKCEPDQTRTPSAKLIKELFTALPNIHQYEGGHYINAFRLFMFCRQDRHYPCLMVMKNSDNQPIYVNRKLWSQPALALSASNLPYNVSNGHTPQGVYQLDSVMPVADQQLSFGKFRRVIVNFVPKSPSEEDHGYLLPKSHMSETWWKQAPEARDLGRALFRIHGTGKQADAGTTYFPFRPTAGCMSQRENTYDGVTYIDQQLLLNRMMDTLHLVPQFENETSIKGLLYLIEIDNKKAAVTLGDLDVLGIR